MSKGAHNPVNPDPETLKKAESFLDFDFGRVCTLFGLRFGRLAEKYMKDWRASQTLIPDRFQEGFGIIRHEVQLSHMAWNEQEFRDNMIAPILHYVHFRGESYKGFSNREIAVLAPDGQTYKGEVDWMVASGIMNPEAPYFFFHEYKREQKTKGDALGQLMMAMLAGRSINQNELPLLGGYVIGSVWRFIVILGSEYAESPGYDVLDEESFSKIWSMLAFAKAETEKRASEKG